MHADRPVRLKLTVDNRDYIFLCEEAAPLGHAWDAAIKFANVFMEQMQAQSQEVNESGEEPAEDKADGTSE